MGEDFPAVRRRLHRQLGVDGDDDALVAELVGGSGEKFGALPRRPC
jgi:hypothetical protein